MSNAQYQYTLQGDNLDDLDSFAPKMLDELKTIPLIVDVSSDQQNRGLQAMIQYDRGTAARFGVTPQLIDATLYDAFGQRQVSTMYTPLNQYHVVMEASPDFWQNPQFLSQVYVQAPSGQQVPLSAFATYAPTTAPLTVTHQGLFPAVTLFFSISSQAWRWAMPWMPSTRLPPKVETHRPPSTPNLPVPHKAYQAHSLSSEPILVAAAALVTVYIILAMLYESYVHPITIISSLPAASVGALLALMLTHNDLSIIAIIGIILLIGIVKKRTPL